MVHNELQYEFIYQFIHHWFNLKNIDDTHIKAKESADSPQKVAQVELNDRTPKQLEVVDTPTKNMNE